jgi:hypothetical protein
VTPAAFYCMSSEVYFLGAVGMINSLRLVGHMEPIYLLDCGLTARHRALLEPHVTVIDAPADQPPFLLKAHAPREHPADVQVLIDVDMVVTRSLGPLIDRAARGELIAVKDRMDRFVPEWGEVLDLGPLRSAPYLSSGLVFLGGGLGREVVELLDDRLSRVDYERSYFGRDEPGYPLSYVDQDVLNAVIAARAGPDRVKVLDPRLAPVPPFRRLRIADLGTLRCEFDDGLEPYVIHHFIVKPWLDRVYHGVYSRLLARLLIGDDVAIRVPREELPLRLRDGLVAGIERHRINVIDLARWYARDVIPGWVGARIDSVRRRRDPGAA